MLVLKLAAIKMEQIDSCIYCKLRIIFIDIIWCNGKAKATVKAEIKFNDNSDSDSDNDKSNRPPISSGPRTHVLSQISNCPMFAHTHTHKHTQISICMCGCSLISQHIECKATRLIKELSAPSPIRFEITHEFNTRHQNGCQSIKLKSAHCVCVEVKTKVNTQLKHTESETKIKIT